MHFCVDGIPEFKSSPLPKSVERGLRSLLQSGGIVSPEGISDVSPPQDSNLDAVGETLDHDVIADGSIALQVVIEGLKRRLSTTIAPNEKILIVAGE